MFFVAYLLGYGAMRGSKVIVRYEHYANMKEGPLVCEIVAGVDARKSGVGKFKNAIAGHMAFFYTPLRLFEEACWGYR